MRLGAERALWPEEPEPRRVRGRRGCAVGPVRIAVREACEHLAADVCLQLLGALELLAAKAHQALVRCVCGLVAPASANLLPVGALVFIYKPLLECLELLVRAHGTSSVQLCERRLDARDDSVQALPLPSELLQVVAERLASLRGRHVQVSRDVREPHAKLAQDEDLLHAVDVGAPVLAVAVWQASRVQEAKAFVVVERPNRHAREGGELSHGVRALRVGVHVAAAGLVFHALRPLSCRCRDSMVNPYVA